MKSFQPPSVVHLDCEFTAHLEFGIRVICRHRAGSTAALYAWFHDGGFSQARLSGGAT